MTQVADRVVQADDLSTAWLETVNLVARSRSNPVFHTATTILDPATEVPSIRAAVEETLAHRGLPPVNTVAGTIFPFGMARQDGDPERLVERYRAAYPTLKRFPGNKGGTYFGRMVAHPDSDPAHDQLLPLIRKLRHEQTLDGPMSARYEVVFQSVADVIMIRSPKRNHSRMGFPCLSLCSFQLDDDRLHLMAHYRSQELVERAYGNYVGLAGLHQYVADQSGLTPGMLTVTAGRLHLDSGVKFLRSALK